MATSRLTAEPKEAMGKIRKGLSLLIEGMIEDTDRMLRESPELNEIQEVASYRIKLIEEYLLDARRYSMSEERVNYLKADCSVLKSKVRREYLI